ncbi:unnamed protein product, partial [Acanthocheilonema viteae]
DLKLFSFGNEIPESYQTTKVELGIKTSESEIITIDAYALNYLTGKLQVIKSNPYNLTRAISQKQLDESRGYWRRPDMLIWPTTLNLCPALLNLTDRTRYRAFNVAWPRTSHCNNEYVKFHLTFPCGINLLSRLGGERSKVLLQATAAETLSRIQLPQTWVIKPCNATPTYAGQQINSARKCKMKFDIFVIAVRRPRPCHVESTISRPIRQVKQGWAWLVLGSETAGESQIL